MPTYQNGQIASGIGEGLLGGLAGALPGGATNTNGTQNTNTSQQTNTNSSSNSSFAQQLQSLLNSISSTTGSGTSTSTTTPNLNPQTQALIDSLTARYQSLTAPSLTGYAAQQTQGINRNAELAQQAAATNLAARGLSASPVAGTTANSIDAQRFGNITGMQEQLPVLQNQMNLSNLGAAAGFMNMIPHGATTTGSTTNQSDTTGTQSQTQGSTGQNFANNWGYSGTEGSQNTVSNNTSQKQGSASSALTGAAGGIATLLAGLFSDVRLKKEIKPIDNALDKIMSLRPVTWKWKGGEVEDAGLLAQDIAKKLPELIDTEDPSGFHKVNYAGLIGTLVGAIQDLATEVK
jgi:hypothetical protein